jgi:quercetin dioxygenase-like cupin family protein
MASLPEPRLVTTSHTAEGISVISSDVILKPFYPFGPTATGFTVFHASPAVPASNSATYEPNSTTAIPRPQAAGTVFCTSDFAPHSKTPMHRTLSLDYCVILAGSIWLITDGGDETEVKAGEMILQRGVNHMWENRADVPCRALCVMVGSEKVVLDNGNELEETKIPLKK